MKTIFLEESENPNRIVRSIRVAKYFNNKIILNTNLQKSSINKKMKIVKRIKCILDKEGVRQLAIQNKLKKDEIFINLLHSNNINICSPKWLLKKCTNQIVDLISKEKNEISICVNEVDMMTQEYIYKFAKEFKRVNIITNHIGKFKKIEENLYNEEGILINITNNRRKSLLKSEIILNVDFPKELINEFSIYDKSIIINWDEPLKIRKKRFNGKIIEEINIELNEDNEITRFIKDNNLQNYDKRDICQVLEKIPDGQIKISSN